MNPEPGWYPDPQNGALQRYWNGTMWSDATRPTPGPAAPVTTRSQKRTSSPAEILRTLSGIALVAIIGFVIFTLVEENKDPSSAQQQSQYQQSIDTRNELASDRTLRDPTTYDDITKRDLEVILKDIRAHTGRRIILHGTIRQFDSATGPDRFLAYVGTSTLGIGNLESAHLIGDAATLNPFVEDDDVKMYVVVDGEYSYTSAADIDFTLPQFQIGIIELAE